MLTMSLENGQVMAQKEGAVKTATHLSSLTPIAQKALLELRNAMHNVESLAAGEQTLPQAVKQLLRDYQSATGCTLRMTGAEVSGLPPGLAQSGLFRMIQESVTNACHHAKAQTISVEFEPSVVRIRDDGMGFDPALIKPGRGLANLKERASELGMALEFDTGPGRGTVVEIRW